VNSRRPPNVTAASIVLLYREVPKRDGMSVASRWLLHCVRGRPVVPDVAGGLRIPSSRNKLEVIGEYRSNQSSSSLLLRSNMSCRPRSASLRFAPTRDLPPGHNLIEARKSRNPAKRVKSPESSCSPGRTLWDVLTARTRRSGSPPMLLGRYLGAQSGTLLHRYLREFYRNGLTSSVQPCVTIRLISMACHSRPSWCVDCKGLGGARDSQIESRLRALGDSLWPQRTR